MEYLSEEEIKYALAKQVPCLLDEVEIHTNYGVLSLEEQDAKAVYGFVKGLLEAKLKVEDANPSAATAYRR